MWPYNLPDLPEIMTPHTSAEFSFALLVTLLHLVWLITWKNKQKQKKEIKSTCNQFEKMDQTSKSRFQKSNQYAIGDSLFLELISKTIFQTLAAKLVLNVINQISSSKWLWNISVVSISGKKNSLLKISIRKNSVVWMWANDILVNLRWRAFLLCSEYGQSENIRRNRESEGFCQVKIPCLCQSKCFQTCLVPYGLTSNFYRGRRLGWREGVVIAPVNSEDGTIINKKGILPK